MAVGPPVNRRFVLAALCAWSSAGAGEATLEGTLAPDWRLQSLDGAALSLADFKGRSLVLTFWATWCAPCRVEAKWLTTLRAQYHGRGLEVLGISMDDAGQETEIARFVRTFGVTYPVLLHGQSIAAAYGGVRYLPQTFFVARSGHIVRQTRGVADPRQLQTEVQEMLK